MAKTYMGKAALTLVRANGGMAYVYAGHVAPDGMDPDDLKRLVKEGFLVEVADPADPPPVEDPLDDVEDPDEGDKRPAKTANKDVWLDFRLGEDGNALTREQLDTLTAPDLKDDAKVAELRAAPPA